MKFSKGTGTILCIAALSYLPTASAVAINLSERSLLQRPSSNSLANFANVTSLSEYPSPHFAAQLGFGDVRLRSTSLLMNAVEALTTLALKDQTAGSSGSHFQADRYSDVVIDVEPQHPATDVLNEVALLCISYGIGHVIRRREYKNAEITCFWDAVVVALVHFERPGYQASSNTTEVLLSPKAESPVASGNNNSSLITTTTANATLLEAVTPVFIFRPDSKTLPIPNVFANVFIALTALAYYPNNRPVGAHTVINACPEWDTSMIFEPYRIRTRPPFFEYRWLIETLRQMPGYLLQQGRFAEVTVGVVVDGVHVGNGVLEKGPPGGVGEKGGEATVRRV